MRHGAGPWAGARVNRLEVRPWGSIPHGSTPRDPEFLDGAPYMAQARA